MPAAAAAGPGRGGPGRPRPGPACSTLRIYKFIEWLFSFETSNSPFRLVLLMTNFSGQEGNLPSKDGPSDNDMSLGKIPPKHERLKDSEGLQISKLCGETEWQPRFLAITADRIIIAHPDQDEISDQIPLVSRYG
jgi:hypothetical protein